MVNEPLRKARKLINEKIEEHNHPKKPQTKFNLKVYSSWKYYDENFPQPEILSIYSSQEEKRHKNHKQY